MSARVTLHRIAFYQKLSTPLLEARLASARAEGDHATADCVAIVLNRRRRDLAYLSRGARWSRDDPKRA